MDNNYDFESSEPTSNGPVQNQPKNNGYTPNNGCTPNNNYTPNNYASNNYSQNNGRNNGGVPLIVIIGIMALIILVLIVYIVCKEIGDASKTQPEMPIDYNNSYITDNEFHDINNAKNTVEDEDVKENRPSSKEEDEDDEPVVKDTEKAPVEETPEDNKGVINTNTSSDEKISTDWKSLEFKLAGKKYVLNTDYKNLINNGWSVDFEKLGYADGYILNKNDKTYSTTNLENEDYEDADVNIGFINLGETAKDVSECQFWAISVDNAYSDTPVDFELPNGIKNGSTLAEVEAAYGIPEDEDDIYISDSLGYRKYSYTYDYEIHFDVTISDTEGVTGFDYKIY